MHGAASFSQLLSRGAPKGARGFVSNQTLTGTPGSWLVVPPPHPRKRHQRTAMLLPWGHSRQSEPLAFLPGTSPGCKGSAESGSAGGAPSSGGVEGGGERGEKQETVREAPVSHWSLAAAPSRAVHRAPTARGSPAALGQAGKGQSRVPSSARHWPRCAKRLEHSQSPAALGGWDGRRTPRSWGGVELTLLLQGQLALGLDVLQRGRQVAWQAACVALGVRGALGQDSTR